jgi:hypothetical protein
MFSSAKALARTLARLDIAIVFCFLELFRTALHSTSKQTKHFLGVREVLRSTVGGLIDRLLGACRPWLRSTLPFLRVTLLLTLS